MRNAAPSPAKHVARPSSETSSPNIAASVTGDGETGGLMTQLITFNTIATLLAVTAISWTIVGVGGFIYGVFTAKDSEGK